MERRTLKLSGKMITVPIKEYNSDCNCPYCGGFLQYFNGKLECRDCGKKIKEE